MCDVLVLAYGLTTVGVGVVGAFVGECTCASYRIQKLPCMIQQLAMPEIGLSVGDADVGTAVQWRQQMDAHASMPRSARK